MKVAVLVLSYNDERHLIECYDSLKAQTHSVIIYHIDNQSPDNSVALVESKYPEVKIIKIGANLGYATAYNIAMEKVFSENSELDAALLLNSDTVADRKMIEELCKEYEKLKLTDKKIGLIQPAVLLYDQPHLVNTIGNTMHYLGFGFCKNLYSAYQPQSPQRILSVSGCAMFVSKEYFNIVGTLDDIFYMYCEDQNYSWRGLLMGFNHYVVSNAVVFHKYKFTNSNLRWYNSEKNRLIMLITNCEVLTLLKIFPLLILLEPLIFLFGVFNGFGIAKLKSYFFVIFNINTILKLRRVRFLNRTVKDVEIIPLFDSKLVFGPLTNILVEKCLNPFLSFYKKLVFRQ